MPCCVNQPNFLFPPHIFVHLYIPVHNSTKPINTPSAGFLPVHQGSHRFPFWRGSPAALVYQGWESPQRCSCLFKGLILRKSRMMFKLTAAHTKSLVSSAGSLAVNTQVHVSCVQGGIMSFPFPITYLAPLSYQLRSCLRSSTDWRYKC